MFQSLVWLPASRSQHQPDSRSLEVAVCRVVTLLAAGQRPGRWRLGVDNYGIPHQVSRDMGSTAMSAPIILLPPCSIPSPAVAAVCGVGRHRATGDNFTFTIQRPEREQSFSHPDLVWLILRKRFCPNWTLLIPWDKSYGLGGEPAIVPKGNPCPLPGEEDYVGENYHWSPCMEQ